MKRFVGLTTAALVFSLTAGFAFAPIESVFADVSCQPIYGGGQTCVQMGKVMLNKTVLNPGTNTFVDNLSINDPKFGPEFITTFQLTVTNTGQTAISHIDVKDTFPQFVSFSSGPGTFDTNTKTLTFGIDNLGPNETRTFTVIGRVAQASDLQQNVTCVVNQAIATAGSAGESRDNAQFCIEKQVTTKGGLPTETKGGQKVFAPKPTEQMPSTGPEALPLLALIPSAITGFILRKKTSK